MLDIKTFSPILKFQSINCGKMSTPSTKEHLHKRKKLFCIACLKPGKKSTQNQSCYLQKFIVLQLRLQLLQK